MASSSADGPQKLDATANIPKKINIPSQFFAAMNGGLSADLLPLIVSYLLKDEEIKFLESYFDHKRKASAADKKEGGRLDNVFAYAHQAALEAAEKNYVLSFCSICEDQAFSRDELYSLFRAIDDPILSRFDCAAYLIKALDLDLSQKLGLFLQARWSSDESKCIDDIAFLLGHGALPNSHRVEVLSLLRLSTRAGHPNIVNLLLAAQADPTLRCRWGNDFPVELRTQTGVHLFPQREPTLRAALGYVSSSHVPVQATLDVLAYYFLSNSRCRSAFHDADLGRIPPVLSVQTAGHFASTSISVIAATLGAPLERMERSSIQYGWGDYDPQSQLPTPLAASQARTHEDQECIALHLQYALAFPERNSNSEIGWLRKGVCLYPNTSPYVRSSVLALCDCFETARDNANALSACWQEAKTENSNEDLINKLRKLIHVHMQGSLIKSTVQMFWQTSLSQEEKSACALLLEFLKNQRDENFLKILARFKNSAAYRKTNPKSILRAIVLKAEAEAKKKAYWELQFDADLKQDSSKGNKLGAVPNLERAAASAAQAAGAGQAAPPGPHPRTKAIARAVTAVMMDVENSRLENILNKIDDLIWKIILVVDPWKEPKFGGPCIFGDSLRTEFEAVTCQVPDTTENDISVRRNIWLKIFKSCLENGQAKFSESEMTISKELLTHLQLLFPDLASSDDILRKAAVVHREDLAPEGCAPKAQPPMAR